MTTRTMLGHALRLALETPGSASSVQCVVADPSDDRAPAQPFTHLVVDLDDEPVERLERWLAAGKGRRIGFFDAFTSRHAERAFDLGITVLLPLTASPEEIRERVLGERRSAGMAAEGPSREELRRLSLLSPRELEVLQHVAKGLPTPAIAVTLAITPHTVETHKRRAFRKLDVQTQAQAVALAVAGGLITSG